MGLRNLGPDGNLDLEPDGNPNLDPDGLRNRNLQRIRGEIGELFGRRGRMRTRKYGWPDEGYDMEMARRKFQNDPTVCGRSGYDSRELTKIIDDVYGEIADDRKSTKSDFLDELEKRIVMYLNQCFALVKGEGTKCMFVEKTISAE